MREFEWSSSDCVYEDGFVTVSALTIPLTFRAPQSHQPAPSPHTPSSAAADPATTTTEPPSSSPPVVHCRKGHALGAYATPCDGCWCSLCEVVVSEGTQLMGCRECDYDLCFACAADVSLLPTCPLNHSLADYLSPVDGCTCSHCEREFPSSTRLFGCRQCDFDLCGRCWMTRSPVNRCPCGRPFPPQSSTTPSPVAEVGSWKCVVCGEAGAVVAGCAACGFALCRGCTPSQSEASPPPVCEKGHVMKQYLTPVDGCTCSRCGGAFPVNHTLFGCRQCDYDLCSPCIPASTTPEPATHSKAPTSPATLTVASMAQPSSPKSSEDEATSSSSEESSSDGDDAILHTVASFLAHRKRAASHSRQRANKRQRRSKQRSGDNHTRPTPSPQASEKAVEDGGMCADGASVHGLGGVGEVEGVPEEAVMKECEALLSHVRPLTHPTLSVPN